MKIKNYIENAGTHPFSLTFETGEDAYIVKTQAFQDLLAFYIGVTYGRRSFFNYIVRTDEDDESTELTPAQAQLNIGAICENIYSTNKYKYDTLYETTVIEYDPIENYSKIESTSESTSFSSSESSSLSTSEQGSESNSHSEQGSEVATEAVIPIQNQGYNDKSKDTKKDNRSASEQGSHNVASTSSGENGKEESFVRSFYSKVSGNIGTLTTQQMLQSSRELALFNFTAIVARDIMQKLMSAVVVLDN